MNDVIAAHGHALEFRPAWLPSLSTTSRPTPPRNGSEARVAADDAMLGRYMHLHALNRDILLTPFHNMALMCPATSNDDVDRHTAAFHEAVEALARLAI